MDGIQLIGNKNILQTIVYIPTPSPKKIARYILVLTYLLTYWKANFILCIKILHASFSFLFLLVNYIYRLAHIYVLTAFALLWKTDLRKKRIIGRRTKEHRYMYINKKETSEVLSIPLFYEKFILCIYNILHIPAATAGTHQLCLSWLLPWLVPTFKILIFRLFLFSLD